ncbi:hypothetical protein V6478_001263 [Providencia rettgeri]|nr:hypothetical protein AM461_10205 [Providencia rettgeri]EJD6377476.1 hypothetical protein [Providencia rettgeri]EJF7713723.1 hypothetical protein [Providencia rettgeri]ELR5068000.1 hypothetical protein [Providencia rettgeri]ELR5117443.1 hypothetical protein [Providencia rettgeri]
MDFIKMNKLLVPIFCIASLSGCAVTEYNYVPDSQKISEPKIGQVNHITVGQPLVREGNISEIDGIKVLNPVQIDLAYKIIPGVFKKVGSSDKGDFYMPDQIIDSGSVVVEVLGQPWNSLLIKKGSSPNEICIVTDVNVAVCSDKAQIEQVKLNNSDGNSFEQALIFNGINDQVVDISYQKIGSNIENQGFGDTIQYNLKNSDIISYRNVKLKVIDSSENSLTYTVISNFSDN